MTPKCIASQLIFSLIISLITLSGSLAAQDIPLEVKVYLEGPYNAQQNIMYTKLYDMGYLPGMQPKSFLGKAVPFYDPYHADIKPQLKSDFIYSDNSVDWVNVSLINASTEELIWEKSAVLMADGHIDDLEVPKTLIEDEGHYHIVVQHRNHISTKSPVIQMIRDVLSHDFTVESGSETLKVIGDVALMIAGNVGNQTDSTIDGRDISQWRKMNGQNSSYFREDVDLNGDISVRDQSIILANLQR